jgi:hypothetical protein
MKGIVFTEFLDLVEDKFGIGILDKLLENSKLESNGIYTAVGTYKHAEMVELVTNLSDILNVSVPDLLYTYGEHFFSVLYKSYPAFFNGIKTSLDFLETIESYIHPEVLKLYPDAELPRFEQERVSENHLELTYISTRKMSAFAHGLMVSTVAHFNENVSIELQQMTEDGTQVKFVLIKND